MSTKQFVDEFNSIESPKLKELLELMNKKEDLHPDLVPYLVVENKIPYLKHPLLYVIMPSEAMYASYNKRYEVIKSMIAKSMEEEDFEGYVFHHERPYRVEAFMDIESNLSDKRYWSLLGEVWTDSENTWQNIDEWNELLVHAITVDKSKVLAYFGGRKENEILYIPVKNSNFKKKDV